MPLKAIKWLLMQHRPLVIQPVLDPAMWRWCLQMLANCNGTAYRVNKSRMVRLAEYSRDCLRALRDETGIRYDERMQGTLQLFRTQQQLDGVGKDVEILQQSGVPFELLDRDGFVRVEPGLATTQHKFVGALRLPGDETGDCFKFTRRLAKMAQDLGAAFRFGVDIQRLEKSGGRITGVHTDAGLLTADQYVLALGSYSTRMLAPLGLRLPVYRSRASRLRCQSPTPRARPSRRSWTRAQGRGHEAWQSHPCRRHGSAVGLRPDLGRRPPAHAGTRLTDLFPRGGDISRAEFWTGLRR